MRRLPEVKRAKDVHDLRLAGSPKNTFLALLNARSTILRTPPKSLALRAQAGKAQAQWLAEPEGVDRVIVVGIAGIRMDQN